MVVNKEKKYISSLFIFIMAVTWFKTKITGLNSEINSVRILFLKRIVVFPKHDPLTLRCG